MKKILIFLLICVFLGGCGFPKETRRGVGNEGFLIILATPNDAEVLVNGENVGSASQFESTPLELKSGTQKIEIRKVGFVPEIREVYAGNQSRHILKINLKKVP
jgi:hypothetical protein